MEQLGTNGPSMIESLEAALTIIVTISGILFGAYKAIKRRRLNNVTYYTSRGVFADRTDSLTDLLQMLKSGAKIVNVYGKRGIGKSAFLRFFCDFTNHKLNKENRRHHITKRYGRPLSAKAIYVHLSGDGTKSIDEQIISQITGQGNTLVEIAVQLVHNISHKRIFVVIDNVNNDGLIKELEAVVDVFLSQSPRYYIIVGSIKQQPFFNLDECKTASLILPTFKENDIFEYAEKNDKHISPDDLTTILTFSDGLPVFVSLLLSNKPSELSSIKRDQNRMDQYLGRIIDDLSQEHRKLAQYIGFLSITNAIVHFSALIDLHLISSSDDLEILENCTLIEYNRQTHSVKMHELFVDYITRRFLGLENNVIEEILEYFEKTGQTYEQSYYSILLEREDAVTSQIIQQAIDEERFTYLISMGEQYKKINDLRSSSTALLPETFLLVIYGYLVGLIGVGNYPAAREVIETCKISARSPESDLQFRFSMLTADLYHLQNNYDESIVSYEILLSCINENTEYRKYKAKCLWGIAHALRHQGKDLDKAVVYYDKSIAAAEELNRKSEIIKSMREKLIILLCRKEVVESEKLYNQIYQAVNGLPKDRYVGTRTSALKTELNYLNATGARNPQLEEEILSKVLNEYKNQRKRLQYNLHFQYGEYYRRYGLFEKAHNSYNIALSFSKKNHDHNLETLAMIGISLCDLCCGKTNDNIIDDLAECAEISETYDLHMNKLLADTLLSYVRGEQTDGATLQELERLKYMSAYRLAREMTNNALQELVLFLM